MVSYRLDRVDGRMPQAPVLPEPVSTSPMTS